jgi:hypothetical protein
MFLSLLLLEVSMLMASVAIFAGVQFIKQCSEAVYHMGRGGIRQG